MSTSILHCTRKTACSAGNHAVTLRTNKITPLISEKRFFFSSGKLKIYILNINIKIIIPNHIIREILWQKIGIFAPLSEWITNLRFVCSFWAQQCKNNNVLIMYPKNRVFLLKRGSSRIKTKTKPFAWKLVFLTLCTSININKKKL